MPKGFADFSHDKFRRENNIRQFFLLFNIPIDSANKATCPFHGKKNGDKFFPESNPSMIVNDEACYCFACARTWYLDTLIQDVLDPAVDVYIPTVVKLDHQPDYEEVQVWWNERKSNIPKVAAHKSRKKGEYRGPVNLELVTEWHKRLTPEHREYLRTHRLLTNDTINLFQIGWRDEHQSFSLPFWSGTPGTSEVQIVQFRKSIESPAWITQKFYGLGGHNKPCFIGKHSLVGRTWAVMLFGTFDAVLAVQDGFPAISPNGASIFSRNKHKQELNDTLQGIQHLFVVLDATESEQKAALNTVANIEVVPKITITKFDETAKDYGEYRLSKSVVDFMVEKLGWCL